LRVRIARWRSYASVLVIPRRKMGLCEALHGRAAMAGVGAPLPAMGSSLERRGRGKGKRVGAMGRGRAAGGGQACRITATAVRGLFVLAVREKQEEGRREEKRRERKERKEKKFKLGNF
jgi:hypothetical protein